LTRSSKTWSPGTGIGQGNQRAAALVLRHVRGHRLLAQLHHEIGAVVGVVGSKRDRLRAFGTGLDQRQRRQPLSWSAYYGSQCLDGWRATRT
jgi:hypothetical protein